MEIPKIIIFDVNETLLDLQPLKQSINTALGDENAAALWFSKLLHYSLVETVTGTYHDFSEIGAAVFKMMAKNSNKEFTDEEIEKVLEPVKSLSAYPDVHEGLSRLKEEGYKLVALSNGKPAVLQQQLHFAEIDDFFSEIISIEDSKKYKPHRSAYELVLEKNRISASQALLVAAHAWDIIGAAEAGMQTCFVQREGKFLYPLAEQPTMVINRIVELNSLLNKV